VIGELRRNVVDVARVGHDRVGVAAGDVESCEANLSAQILAPFPAPWASPVRPGKPRHADPIAVTQVRDSVACCLDDSHYLMAGDEWQRGRPQFALNDVQIGVTDAAGGDADAHLPRRGVRHGDLDQGQWRRVHREGGLSREHQRPHRTVRSDTGVSRSGMQHSRWLSRTPS